MPDKRIRIHYKCRHCRALYTVDAQSPTNSMMVAILDYEQAKAVPELHRCNTNPLTYGVADVQAYEALPEIVKS